MDVNGDIPEFREFFYGAGVIEMTMGEDDRVWARGWAKAFFCGAEDELRGEGHAGVDENPFAGGIGDEIEVDQESAQAEDSVGNVEGGGGR